MSPLAVVTGASGFVGGGVARELLDAGYDVRATARSRAAASAIRDRVRDPRPSLQIVEGDVLERGSLEDAFAGSNLVVHAAGVVAACPRDPSGMLRTNVIGTTNAVTAAARARVARFVLTSSAATIGERAGQVGREDTPHRGWFLSSYERSKAEGEAAAFALGRDLGLDVLSVNPASVQGPGRADGTARLLLAAARGRLPVATTTTISFVDVDDCARGHVLAAERGSPGRRYLLCGATMSAMEALALVDRVTGRSRRRLAVSGRVVSAAAAVVETAFRALLRDPPFCREVAAAIEDGRAYDGSLATRALGLGYTPAEETVRRTIAWFRSAGLLR